MTSAVLCFIVKDNRVLLAMKKRGFGEGWWNGAGGKIKDGETPLEAILREMQEEVGIMPHDPVHHGTLHFFFEDGTPDWEVRVFRAEEFDGEPSESEEMRPAWFNFEDIPYDSMWKDDPHWLPLLLEGKRFEGKFTFRDNDTLLSHEVREF
jgi:8-oxo-dGTP pyrophosphatase MutT (NUDIX family)